MKKAYQFAAFTIATTMAWTTASARQKPIEIMVPFDPAETAWANARGTASISGTALLRTVGGEAKTCAAQQIALIPVSKYSTARISIMFVDETKPGFREMNDLPSFTSTDDNYSKTVRLTSCDAQGNFSFEHVPAGSYYLTAQVTWGIPHGYLTTAEGGLLMKPITLAAGDAERVVMTP